MNTLKKGIGVVGSTTVDKIVAVDQSYFKQGGVTTYAGITYRRHGIPAFVASNLAERDSKLIRNLETEKIEIFTAASDRTTHFVNYIQGQRRHQELVQEAGPIHTEQIRTILPRVDGLHLGPLHPLDIEPAALKLLQNSNLPVFLDVQGYTRRIEGQKIYPSVSGHLTAGLVPARVIKANGFEHQLVLDFYQIDLTELMVRFNIEESVVTLGKDGGFVRTQSDETFEYAAEPATAPVDPTGAGDVFFAAYILSRFSSQMNIPEACRYAARIAARQVEGRYITDSQIGLD